MTTNHKGNINFKCIFNILTAATSLQGAISSDRGQTKKLIANPLQAFLVVSMLRLTSRSKLDKTKNKSDARTRKRIIVL